MPESDIVQAVESLSSRWLGRYGIVSVADVYEPDGPAVLVLVNGDIDAAKGQLPAMTNGFRVLVRRSGPIVTHAHTG
jgi:hypothetical protein